MFCKHAPEVILNRSGRKPFNLGISIKLESGLLADLFRKEGNAEEFCSTFIMQGTGEGTCGSSFMWDKCPERIQKYMRGRKVLSRI